MEEDNEKRKTILKVERTVLQLETRDMLRTLLDL